MKTTLIIQIAVLAGIIILLGLLGTKTWNPVWNPFDVSEERLIENSIKKLIESKTFICQAELLVSAQGLPAQTSGLPESGALAINIQTMTDLSKIERPKTASAVSFSLSSQNMAISAELELKTIEDSLFIKLISLPPILSGFVSQEMIDALLNQWIEISSEKVAQMTGSELKPADQETTKEFIKDLSDIVKDKAVFKVKKTLSVNHYLAEFNKEAIKQIIPEYLNLAEKYLPPEQISAYQQNMEQAVEQMPQAIDQLWQEIGPIEFEVWLDSNQALQKIELEKQFSKENTSTNIAFQLTVEFSGIGEPVEILTPADAQPFDQILLPLLMFSQSSLSPSLSLPPTTE